MKILTIVGARPQFVKAAVVSKQIRMNNEEILLHTGQHYDKNMSEVFFTEMGIPEPDFNLEIGSGPHGKMTGRMLEQIEQVLIAEKPDMLLVYGDTNSTIAGALAACKLHVPVAHVEAGLRSFNKAMPEEHNRILTDHCSNLLFCPTEISVNNLKNENITEGVHIVGDVMYDAVLNFSAIADERSNILTDLGISPKSYSLLTIHRPYNTDDPEVLSNIFKALNDTGKNFVFPIHPRTRSMVESSQEFSWLKEAESSITLIDPVGYLDMLVLENNSEAIFTDSGGIQKESYFFGIPCITLRPETEWLETVEEGWNILVGNDPEKIISAASSIKAGSGDRTSFGDGKAAEKICAVIEGAK
ncbi:MAG: non-hydrolyzing UDP-N-acetylglucosamine 2-epimerase [Planctomycetota bacterium]|jgi:UDP-N-acetylglucosamine 2-epimerase